MDNIQVVENFFGVYLLYCNNVKYKGRTYIGYTVNPKRRIKQHNAGKEFGGAWKTSNRGPWNMILIIHGFPNSTAALRFEWAWQHPQLSRRLKQVPRKKSKETVLNHKLMVLSVMLNTGPWCRLPLTIRWLDDEFGEKYGSCLSPPLHMPIAFGKVTSKKLKCQNQRNKRNSDYEDVTEILLCYICKLEVQSGERVTCLKPYCPLIAHLICLAEKFSTNGMILPIEGSCPACSTNTLWGDLIRKKIGCTLDPHMINHQSSTESGDSANEENDDCDDGDDESDNNSTDKVNKENDSENNDIICL